MEKTEHIILIKFETKQVGLDYLSSSDLKFSFKTEDGEFFSSLGDLITEPESYEEYLISEISISDKLDPLPGELYIENDFLKYYKEV